MLLRNFDHHLTSLMTSAESVGAQSSVPASSGVDITTITTNGAASSVVGFSTSSGGAVFPISLSYRSICIGNGTKEVEYDDYRLAGSIIGTVFENVSNSIVFDVTSNCWIRTLTVKYSNTLDEDFVVSEWGIWRPTGSGVTSYSNNTNICALVYRELLDDPITIAANSTATLTFTLRVPHEVNAF